MLVMIGLSVAKGVAIGKAYVMKQGQTEVPEYFIEDEMIDSEIERYSQAVKTTRTDLQKTSEKICKEISGDVVDFVASQVLILDEIAIDKGPRTLIRKKKINAEWALKQKADELTNILEEIDDSYLKSVQNDILQVTNLILNTLNQQGVKPLEKENFTSPIIVISKHLNPSDLVSLTNKNIKGFISEHDAPSSHTSIMAKNLGIPVVTGFHNIHQCVEDGEEILIDGKYGTICINPEEKSINRYKELSQEIFTYKQNLQLLNEKPIVSLDNKEISFSVNLDSSCDFQNLKKTKTNGVGLYRTESLFLNRKSLPDETEQFNNYKKLAEFKIPVNIRTLDVGADEILPELNKNSTFNNPMLGLRAIRLCLSEKKVFITQLRAIIRASAFGELNILLPMIISVDELLEVKGIIENIKEDLKNKEIDFNSNIKIGVMVETPAMAITIDLFAKHTDFFAIGTNDLVQYILAIDRADEQVSHLYNTDHPAILKTIYQILQSAKIHKTPVYICGEIASNPYFTKLLLGMGFDSFSVSINQFLEIKKIILNTNIKEAELYVNEILKTSSLKRIKQLIQSLNDDRS